MTRPVRNRTDYPLRIQLNVIFEVPLEASFQPYGLLQRERADAGGGRGGFFSFCGIHLRFTLRLQVVSEELIDPTCSGECQIKKVWCVQGGVLMNSIMLQLCLLNYSNTSNAVIQVIQ